MSAWAAFQQLRRVSGTAWAMALAMDRVLPIGLLRVWRRRVVPGERLAAQLDVVLERWGMPQPQRAVTVDMILYADLHGIDSHGCCMLPFYHQLWVNGDLNMGAVVETVSDGPATALLDAGGGLGHVPARAAMTLAMEKARVAGIAIVAVRNSGHFGAAGVYARMAADAGMIGLVTTSTPTASVVPTFGLDPALGTNPIAIAAPGARNAPFLLDMATSTVSLGKLLEYWRRGRFVPDGWATNRRGATVYNGRAAYALRRLTPLGGDRRHGGHKGYGLGAAVEILSAILPDLSPELPAVGHCFVAIDPEHFGAGFPQRLDAFLDRLRDSRPAREDQPVLVPGDPERSVHERRSVGGMPLARGVFEDIRGVAAATGVPFLLDVADDNSG